MIGYDDLLSSDEDSETGEKSNFFTKHLRKCFIAIDGTGYCEPSLLSDLRIFDEKTHENSCNSKELTDDQLRSILIKRIDADSYEYATVQKPKTIRKPSNTKSVQSRLEKEKSVEIDLSNSKFPWSNQPEDAPTKTREELFKCKETAPVQDRKFVSAVTESLLNEKTEANVFLSYAEFEAMTGNDSNKAQNLRIFLPMCDKSESVQKTSMLVSVYKSAKISDLIGLICCKYLNEKLTPKLNYTSVDDYMLRIAEENGEVENELSPLDSKYQVGKFEFVHLALVERIKKNKNLTIPTVTKKTKIIVHFTDDTPAQTISYDAENIKLRMIHGDLCEFKNQFLDIFCPLIAYRLEHIDEPGVACVLDEPLTNYKNYEFYFFRENSVRTSSISNNSEISPQGPITDIQNLMTKNAEFKVHYMSKWSKVEFKIELSIDSFDLEETKTSHIGINKKKSSNYYSIPIKNVCACSDLSTTSKIWYSGDLVPKSLLAGSRIQNSQIRIIVAELQSENNYVYKHLDFECDPATAQEIKSSLSYLLLYCNSSIARDYKSSTKISTKWSRKLYNLQKSKNTSL